MISQPAQAIGSSYSHNFANSNKSYQQLIKRLENLARRNRGPEDARNFEKTHILQAQQNSGTFNQDQGRSQN